MKPFLKRKGLHRHEAGGGLDLYSHKRSGGNEMVSLNFPGLTEAEKHLILVPFSLMPIL